MKKNIIIIFGGKSAEHDISIITGMQVLNNINKNHYNVIPLYISSGGAFYVGKPLFKLECFVNFNPLTKGLKSATFISGKPYIFIKNFKHYKIFTHIDCAILCTHGLNGEDGTLQGILELSDIPYTSPGVLSSAICMDKIIMKDIFKANDMPITPYVHFLRHEYKANNNHFLSLTEEKLGFPVIVKPSNLGSSIGINKCDNAQELKQAIEVAMMFDSRIIVEKFITDLKEINCAVMGTTHIAETSELEQPISWQKFLTFDEKYVSNIKDKKEVLKGKDINLDQSIKDKIKEISLKAYKICACSGVVRIDYLYDNKNSELYINEINTIPGSLSNYLWNKKDYTFSKMIDKLIANALMEYSDKTKNNYSFKSPVLIKYIENSPKIRKSKIF